MNDQKVVFLSDGEVVLRPPQKSDLPMVVVWMNDPEIREYITLWYPCTLEAEEDWLLRRKDNKEDIVLVIEVSGVPIGIMGLHKIDPKNRNATTGTVIGNKDYWGKKYGQRAKRLLLEYAFEEVGLNKVNSVVIEYNQRSQRYSLACGYKIEGRLRQQVFKKGRFWDTVLLGITRDDWVALQKQKEG